MRIKSSQAKKVPVERIVSNEVENEPRSHLAVQI